MGGGIHEQTPRFMAEANRDGDWVLEAYQGGKVMIYQLVKTGEVLQMLGFISFYPTYWSNEFTLNVY
ncbi:hypothetical protein [Lusitaniella coriacea]|uniref:hypothetical protein n=1 Tax=Lusitaniella coriacea TaxID=1983105 RepID=UPI003CF7E524